MSFLNLLSISKTMNLSIIASTLDPVSSKPLSPLHNTAGSFFQQAINPTHTFANPPENLEVLIVPGGLTTRAPAPGRFDVIDYIKSTYPNLRYIISVCTGVTLLARAGILEGKHATGNKMAWKHVTAYGSNITWVPVARWVVDGNIWTTSGVSAGMDGMLAYIEHIYGREQALASAKGAEYEWHQDPSWDPFAAMANVPGANATQATVSDLFLYMNMIAHVFMIVGSNTDNAVAKSGRERRSARLHHCANTSTIVRVLSCSINASLTLIL
jgi:putative intracellular protease/amidase